MPKRYGTAGPRALFPSACLSPSLAACDPMAQLLFDRMLTQADDQGRLPADPNVVKALCMALIPRATPKLIEGWIGELEAEGMLLTYEADGVVLAQFSSWWDHQAGMKKSYPSRYSAPPGWTDRVRGVKTPTQGHGAPGWGDDGGTSSPRGGTSPPDGGTLPPAGGASPPRGGTSPPSARAPSASASASASRDSEGLPPLRGPVGARDSMDGPTR